MPSHPVHLTGKIVGQVLKTAYPSGQPGSFSDEIADLLRQLDAISIAPAPASAASRLADIIAREWDDGAR
ncbi:hypothetical protein [Sphingomonas sp. MMS24-J13]|uniref:hypothetical protein n=1 Tax=Sphingomonas sp. MMS24-J13 TaxID=3238686 RepID=UPI0038508B7D